MCRLVDDRVYHRKHEDPPSPIETRAIQYALAATVNFIIAGLLTCYFAKGEQDQRNRQGIPAKVLEKTNQELQETQRQLIDRLTEVPQMDERLQRITQMATLGEGAGQMAHEIRNPRKMIKSAARMPRKKTIDPSIRQHISVLLEDFGTTYAPSPTSSQHIC